MRQAGDMTLGGRMAWVGVLVLMLAPSGTAYADTILNPGPHDTSFKVSAGEDGTPPTEDTTNALGAARSLTTDPVSAGGFALAGSVSAAGYDLTASLFQIDVAQSLSGAPGSFGRATGDIYFTVDQDATYALAGSYVVAGGPVDTTDFTVILADLTAPGGTLFTTGGTPGSNNVLGGPGLAGDLLPGHEYVLRYRYGITNNSTGPAGAGGDLSLKILDGGGGTAVPLPSSAWAGLALLGGLGVARECRRVAHARA